MRWPALRGLNAAAPGVGDDARFTTGAAFDVAPPTFAGLVGLSWDFERMNDECVDELVERFVFDIDLGAAQDDGGTNGLTLMLFQTSGPNVMGMPQPIPARAWPNGREDARRSGWPPAMRWATSASRESCATAPVSSRRAATSRSACTRPSRRSSAAAAWPARAAATAGRWRALALAALLLRRRTRTR